MSTDMGILPPAAEIRASDIADSKTSWTSRLIALVCLLGIAIGLVAALALGRVAASLIYGVSSRDLVTFLAVTMLLILVSFAASLIPAFRATRVDPLAVLRDE